MVEDFLPDVRGMLEIANAFEGPEADALLEGDVKTGPDEANERLEPRLRSNGCPGLPELDRLESVAREGALTGLLLRDRGGESISFFELEVTLGLVVCTCWGLTNASIGWGDFCGVLPARWLKGILLSPFAFM